MKKYRVDVLEIQGIGKKMHYGGEEITEKDLPPGHAELMEKMGKISLIKKNSGSDQVEPKEEVKNEPKEKLEGELKEEPKGESNKGTSNKNKSDKNKSNKK